MSERITPEIVLKLAESMRGRDRTVLGLYYGIDGDCYGIPEIARVLKVTRARARGMLYFAENLLLTAIFDESMTVEMVRQYLQAGVTRRRAGIGTDPGTDDT